MQFCSGGKCEFWPEFLGLEPEMLLIGSDAEETADKQASTPLSPLFSRLFLEGKGFAQKKGKNK